MTRWRLYYDNGSTFDASDGEPWQSPPWGVVLCIQPHLTGNERLMQNGDVLMYRTDLDKWTQCGHDGLVDHAVHFGHVISCFRVTRWTHGTVHDGHFARTLERARSDLDG